jgi:hypothetical protein
VTGDRADLARLRELHSGLRALWGVLDVAADNELPGVLARMHDLMDEIDMILAARAAQLGLDPAEFL